jgi:hypothetical protein
MRNNKLLFCLLGATLLPVFGLLAQSAGLLVSDEKYREVPVLPAYSGVKYNEIPVKVSLKKYCPVAGDQRRTGTCVGWAVGYGATTIQRAIQTQTTDKALITQYANSAAFIYNQVRSNHTDCSEGAYLEDALRVLKEKGDCLESSFAFNPDDCHALPDEKSQWEAQQFKAQDYAAVFTLDEDPKNKIGKVCKVLATQTPLVVGMGITKSFFDLLPGATQWDPADSETVSGYHALVLIGYNSVEKYVELLNSFGPSWGQNGFIRVNFSDFERLCRYAYVIVPQPNTATAFVPAAAAPAPGTATPAPAETAFSAQYSLEGAFAFRQPSGSVTNAYGEEVMFFEEISTKATPESPGNYTTERAVFNVGDVFQLVAREVPKGRYIYVFSQNAQKEVNLHFPRRKENMASAGFMLEKTVEVVIPSEDVLLQIPMPGYEHLCILYSHAAIPGFDQRLAQLNQHNGAFAEQIKAAFGDVLIPNAQFSAQKMSFKALADPVQQQLAVAITLKVYAQ